MPTTPETLPALVCDRDGARVAWYVATQPQRTPIDARQLDEMTRGYATAALWADCLPASGVYVVEPDNTTHRFDNEEEARRWTDQHDHRGVCDVVAGKEMESGGREGLELRPEALARYRHICAAFIAAHADDLETYAQHIDISAGDGGPFDYAGHDLWLSSHGHGAGFFDRFPAPPIDAGTPERTAQLTAERAPLYDLGERLQKAASSTPFEDIGGSLCPIDCGDGTAELMCA